MFNIISALVVSGALSATVAGYLMDLEGHTQEVTKAYVVSAEARFRSYEDMLPGVVVWSETVMNED